MQENTFQFSSYIFSILGRTKVLVPSDLCWLVGVTCGHYNESIECRFVKKCVQRKLCILTI